MQGMMPPETLPAKLARLQREKGTRVGLLMRPQVSKMPLPMQRYDDPFLPFGKAILNAARDLICCVVFDLASYMVLGAAGMVALERTIAYGKGDAAIILHAPFANEAFNIVMDEASFNVDGVTAVDKLYNANWIRLPDLDIHLINAHAGGFGDDFADVCRHAVEEARKTVR